MEELPISILRAPIIPSNAIQEKRVLPSLAAQEVKIILGMAAQGAIRRQSEDR